MTKENETEVKWTLFYDPHSREKGKKTKELVDKLHKELIEKLGKDLHSQPVKCEPTPYFGEYSTASTLANIDLAVVNKSKEVKVLCEIEERGASPKKIIGDIVNIFLAEKIMIRGAPHDLDNLYFILGIKVKESGKSAEKADNLEGLIQDKIPKLRNRIKIVCDNNINNLIDKIKEKILDKIEALSSP